MASATLHAEDIFPNGTTVSALPQSNYAEFQKPPTANVGAVAATATVTNGVASFSGLADDTAYFATATVSGNFRAVSFRTPALQQAKTVGVGSLTDLQRNQGFAPTGAIAENIPRWTATGSFAAETSGTLLVAKGPVLPAGATVSTITFLSGGGGFTTLTHSWAALLDTNLNVLAKTADNTAAWAANTGRTFTFSTPYTATSDMATYAGLLVVFASGGAMVTSGSMAGQTNGTSGGNPLAPIMVANSTTGLNVPSDLGATAAALTAPAAANVPYCAVA